MYIVCILYLILAKDIALISSMDLLKVPYPITCYGLETVAIQIKFDFSGCKNFH